VCEVKKVVNPWGNSILFLGNYILKKKGDGSCLLVDEGPVLFFWERYL